MTKRLVEIDDELLDAARQALRTTTIKDTVNEALAQASLEEDRVSEVEAAFTTLAGLHLSDAGRVDAWR